MPNTDAYYLGLAERVASGSPDPHTRHGCVIVGPDGDVLSSGCNGPPTRVPIDAVPLTRPEKYAWFIHAEDRAVISARADLTGGTAFITGFPCAACVRRLVEAGVARIAHGDRGSASLKPEEYEIARCIADVAGVRCELVRDVVDLIDP